uniref:Uncharacterized protein n=1 Tax=Macrostomum lignano TaxID=282301 RepID=A0A1I8FAZ9_9PLAT
MPGQRFTPTRASCSAASQISSGGLQRPDPQSSKSDSRSGGVASL